MVSTPRTTVSGAGEVRRRAIGVCARIVLQQLGMASWSGKTGSLRSTTNNTLYTLGNFGASWGFSAGGEWGGAALR
ncbi:hypothetical protein GA0111570_1113 [Raineyella antarctica]|uniref:Uncharacterized protein n=1 Tax=Raineyella antarctica TaxID=1577474 RepID=A0A1G6HJD3_9ACTN|nr:hypothetical protein GA0111570_1113 [Raineyella antarctica]